MSARDILLQIAQVLTTILLAPLIQAVIIQFEERVQRAQGPGLFQPYRDLWKLFHKEIVAPQTASWLLRGPGRGLHVHARRTDSDSTHQLSAAALRHGGHLVRWPGPHSRLVHDRPGGARYVERLRRIGSSRAVMVAILAEPTLILVFVGITLLAKAMLPFVVNHLLVSSWAAYWSPAHLFLAAAFFILLLVETDRMPIHSSTHIEVYMIDEGRILEYSGPLLALIKCPSSVTVFRGIAGFGNTGEVHAADILRLMVGCHAEEAVVSQCPSSEYLRQKAA